MWLCALQVPQFIMEAAQAAGQMQKVKIVAAQPRRLITTGTGPNHISLPAVILAYLHHPMSFTSVVACGGRGPNHNSR
jgi:hypothetical protein